MQLNSYTRAVAGLVLFATVYTVLGFINTPNTPATAPTTSHSTIDLVSVGPDCNTPVKPVGVETSTATGVCTLIIDREQHPFIAVRSESVDAYDRTSPANTADKLVVRIKGGQLLNAWLNDLPSPAYDTWSCGFDVAAGSIGTDTCDDKPLQAAVS